MLYPYKMGVGLVQDDWFIIIKLTSSTQANAFKWRNVNW